MISKRLKTLAGFFLALSLSSSAFAVESNGWIVKFQDGSKAYEDKSVTALGEVTPLPVSFGTFAKLDGELSDKSLELLASHPEVLYIEPNYIYTFSPMVGEDVESSIQDADFSRQWGLQNTGRNSGRILLPGRAGEDVNALEAWEITKGSRELIVAVIDTGVDYTHPDLAANILINEAELNGTPGEDSDGNGYVDDIYGYSFAEKTGDPMDRHGHGTHCAGVIGAIHNSIGIRGVMADVKILPIKFLSDSGRGDTADAILSIDYAISRGAHVMSNSWGGGGRSEALFEAISRANDAGIAFIAAAGNSRADNDSRASYPANYELPNVISVGAMDGRGGRSSFSNYGQNSVHVFAPGSDILSTVTRGRYQNMSGTSMAAPFVSGIVGLLLAEEPNLTPEEIRTRIVETSVMSSSLRGSAQGGRADAARALRGDRSR
jgi:thermitase